MSESTERVQLFRSVPGPGPWYLKDDFLPIRGISWEHAPRGSRAAGGKTLMRNASGIVGVFDFNTYVKPLDEFTLVVWNQKRKNADAHATAPVELLVIDLRNLTPLSETLDVVYERMAAEKAFFFIGGTPSERLLLQTSNIGNLVQVEFPSAMRMMDELLILCHSSDVRNSQGSAGLSLLVAEPRASFYRLYPQDWFNNADLDFGYEWVARVVRNPNTGHVEGEGFRIPPFVLDESLRTVSKTSD